MKTDYCQNIETILYHYGLDSQLEKTMEELGECKDACRNYLHLKKNYLGKDREQLIEKARLHLAEEMADAQIMLDQLKMGLGNGPYVHLIMGFKIDRQLERMREGK